MKTPDHFSHHEILKQCVYVRCKQLSTRGIAIVGTGATASFLLSAIENKDIVFRGIFQSNRFHDLPSFKGHTVRPLRDLSECDKEDVVIIASTASMTELRETYLEIQSHCSCRILPIKFLMVFFEIITELKEPLNYKFEKFIFDRWYINNTHNLELYNLLLNGIDLKDKTVLELGPFEGNNSMALMEFGPRKVIGIEARPSNYAKIAVLKSLLGWDNYSLLLGDMHIFPQLINEKIDIIFCSGVFYHTDQPWWLLKTCMDNCDTILLLGHVSSKHSPQPRQFKQVVLESGTYEFEIYNELGDNLSGVQSQSLWFKEKDLVHFLDYHGFGYKKYNSWVNTDGLWICSRVNRY